MDAPITVHRPHTTIARLLIAPSTSPSSIALAVPTAWDAVPIARPLEIGLLIRKSLQINSAAIFPSTPVITVVSTFVVMIVTGKVTDFLISRKGEKKNG